LIKPKPFNRGIKKQDKRKKNSMLEKKGRITKMVENINFEYTDRAVSAWGGMRLMKELIDKTRIREKLQELSLPQPGSNHGYCPIQIVESFWVSVWTGASRFVHSGWLRYDKVLGEIFQWKRVPSQST